MFLFSFWTFLLLRREHSNKRFSNSTFSVHELPVANRSGKCSKNSRKINPYCPHSRSDLDPVSPRVFPGRTESRRQTHQWRADNKMPDLCGENSKVFDRRSAMPLCVETLVDDAVLGLSEPWRVVRHDVRRGCRCVHWKCRPQVPLPGLLAGVACLYQEKSFSSLTLLVTGGVRKFLHRSNPEEDE